MGLASAHLYRFFGESVRFNAGFFIAIGMAVFVWYLLYKTTWGFELRTVGKNPDASRYAGISTTWITILAMSLSGALAAWQVREKFWGLPGVNPKPYLRESVSTLSRYPFWQAIILWE
jgi:hypothetical protein